MQMYGLKFYFLEQVSKYVAMAEFCKFKMFWKCARLRNYPAYLWEMVHEKVEHDRRDHLNVDRKWGEYEYF